MTVPALALIAIAVVQSAAEPQGDRLTLDWPAGARPTIESADDEIVLRFDAPPGEAAIAGFGRAAGSDIAQLDYNDDSMVIRPAAGRRFVAAVAGARLTITVIRAAIVVTDDSADRDFALAQVGADAAAGYPGRARRRAVALGRNRPDDRQVARTLADLDTGRGAVVRAATRYRALGADDAVARRAIRAGGGEASLLAIVRDGSGFSQAEAGVRLNLPIGPAWTVGGAIRGLRTRAIAAVDRAGAIHGIGRRDGIGEVTAVMLGDVVRVDLGGAVDLSRGRAGASARLALGAAEREIRLSGAWHLPDLTTAEQSLLGGYVDRLGAGGTLRLSPGVAVQADVARQRYGLAGEGRVAMTTLVTAGLDAVVRRQRPALNLIYRLEAEYVGRLDRRPGGALTLPLVDRENHTAQALVAEQLGPWRLAAAGGWTFDRFGGNGPTATLTAARYLGDAWQIEGAGGVSSIRRPNLAGTQLFARASVRYNMGRGS